MKITRQESAIQLTFLPRAFPVNCYLVEEADGLTLIDAGLPHSARGILLAASELGKPIVRIVLTHAHGDHVGALDALKQVLPHVPVMISGRDARLLAGERGLEAGEPDTPIRGGVPASLKTRPDVLLKDGDRVGSLLAVAAPGHTPGSMAFLDTRNGALIAGDAFQTQGGIAVAGQIRLFFPFPAFGTWNKRKAWESAERLAELKPRLLATGHGPMLAQPGQAMRNALERAKRNLERTEKGATAHVTSNRS